MHVHKFIKVHKFNYTGYTVSPGMKVVSLVMKFGGDKGGGTFKMSFQIVNVKNPNAANNTCACVLHLNDCSIYCQ